LPLASRAEKGITVKRSKSIQLILLGGLSSATLTGCHQKPAISTQNVYTNNFYIPGAGYYHAPFRSWYSLPYNHFDAQNQLYFFGGQWGAKPFESITNISYPTLDAVHLAENSRTDIQRGGFGGYAGSHFGGYSGGHYWGGGWGGGWSGFHS
jgi:hypothetical protein